MGGRSIEFLCVPLLLGGLLGCGGNPASTVSAPTPTQPKTSSFSTLTFLTYNVLADQVRLDERLPALLKTLEDSHADVIALQEADDWLLNALDEQSWFKSTYHGTRTRGRLDAPGGQCVLSRIPILGWEWFDLPGVQGRTAVIVRLSVNGNDFSVATFHLESPLKDGLARAKQLDAAFSRLGTGDAVVMGDFNFAEGASPESEHLPGDFIDLWAAINQGTPGFTWDIERNSAAREGAFPGEKSGRIDRILVRSDRWTPGELKLVGDNPIASTKDHFPSDHFGVIGSVTLKGQKP